MKRIDFYLGTHKPYWLKRPDMPLLFVSRRRLSERPHHRTTAAAGEWALDSGGFTDLDDDGRWDVTTAEYAAEAERWRATPGRLRFATPMDWMCEERVLAKTGLTVLEHQRRTVQNFCELRLAAPLVPWIPVVQGYTVVEYLQCVRLYEIEAGADLARYPLVGVGSVCRRQSGPDGARVIGELAAAGLKLHAFGFKTEGLLRSADRLVSADSMAWSLDARRAPPLPGCKHRSCANCPIYAIRWRDRLARRLREERGVLI